MNVRINPTTVIRDWDQRVDQGGIIFVPWPHPVCHALPVPVRTSCEVVRVLKRSPLTSLNARASKRNSFAGEDAAGRYWRSDD